MKPNETQQQRYEEIMKIYDAAEGIIDVVEFGGVREPESYVPLVENLIEDVEKSTEILAQAYILFVETGEKPDDDEKAKVEEAMRTIFGAIERFRTGTRTMN